VEYPALLHSRYEDQDGQRSALYLLELHDKKRISDFAKHVQTWSMKIPIEPSILYFGTPVVLISTLNEDASLNVAPMSSAWWLGWNCMLGLGAKGHTAQNLLREKECVLNLPSVDQVVAVNRLARTTGSDPVPPHKLAMGYRHEKDKLGIASLTTEPSQSVRPARIVECPVQLEAVLETVRPFGTRPDKDPTALAFEVRVVAAHIDSSLLVEGVKDRVDPDKWRPLIMSFCRFYGLGAEIFESTLAEIPESSYRPVAHMTR
jgi:flavin reductase (DIM6/NTAB) family NADH-FMN oxidoreductase RutF